MTKIRQNDNKTNVFFKKKFVTFCYTNNISGVFMTYNEAKEMIMEMYPGRLYVGKKEVCTLLGLSIPTLDRQLKKDSSLAKVAKKESRRVLFPVPDLARVLADEN